MDTLDNEMKKYIEQCHMLADLFDKETALINKNNLKELPYFTKMKSRLVNNMPNLNEIFLGNKVDMHNMVSAKRPLLEGAKKRLDESIKKNQESLARSKSLLENLLRYVAQKVEKQDQPKNVYNKQSHIIGTPKNQAQPVTCNKVC